MASETLDKMVWVDIESTGLDEQTEIILEIGVYVTDLEGIVQAGMSTLVYTQNMLEQLDCAVDVVREMHEASGLRQDLMDLLDHQAEFPESKLSVNMSAEATAESIIRMLTEMGLEAGVYPMCGSTINFDRAFLYKHMRALHDWFHYRNVDISSVKNLCMMLNPAVYAQKPPHKSAHRAGSDIADTVNEYLFYLDNFLHVHLPPAVGE